MLRPRTSLSSPRKSVVFACACLLAADGTVKHVFPVKSMNHGLTEAAADAARRVRFEPAERAGQPVSQFVTLVYDFKGGKAAKPYVPRTIF